jgi:curved DNA-binding protein CbpA
VKDYYKILGVKESASEEEIRTRWIELTKQYHPDRGGSRVSNERIKEINEAYQVLKHSSTRVEYDLKRTYRNKKRRFNPQKLAIPFSILIIFIIIGAFYFKEPQEPSLSKLIVSNDINTTTQKPKDTIDLINTISPIDSENKENQIDQKNQIDQRNQKNQSTQVAMATQSTPVNPDRIKQANPVDKMDSKTKKLDDVKAAINPASPTNKTDANVIVPTTPKVEMTQQLPLPPEVKDLKTQQLPTPSDPIEAKTQKPKDPREPTEASDPMRQLGYSKPPSLLPTENEIKNFFYNYMERYNRMDIEGFLSLFSSKAIQNQKDGPEEIRKIYINFFNQGKEVRYHIQDMKSEIYQNSLEVRARYEIEQILKMGGEKKVWRGNIRWVLGKENGVLRILSLDYQHQKGGGR